MSQTYLCVIDKVLQNAHFKPPSFDQVYDLSGFEIRRNRKYFTSTLVETLLPSKNVASEDIWLILETLLRVPLQLLRISL